MLYMDKEAASAGATVVHSQGMLAGQMIGHAPLVEGCPQFALGVDMAGGRGAAAMVAAIDRHKTFTGAVRAEYRSLGVTNTLARGSRSSDGAGRSTIVESGPRIAPRQITHDSPCVDEQEKEGLGLMRAARKGRIPARCVRRRSACLGAGWPARCRAPSARRRRACRCPGRFARPIAKCRPPDSCRADAPAE